MTLRRKTRLLLAAVATATLGMSACTDQPAQQRGGERAETVIFDMDSGKPESIDNFSPYSRNSNNGLIQTVYEPLFVSDVKTGKLQPWLGLSMSSNPSYTGWVLKLRPGVTWADGQPFTSADVVYTLEALKSGKLGDSGSRLANVTATATDPQTVDLALAKPDPRLDASLFGTAVGGQAVIVLPKHIWEQQSDPKTFNNYDVAKHWPIGTGPYELTGVTPNAFSYTRRDNWWGVSTGFMSLPAPKKAQWTALGTESTRAAALAKGDLDQASQFSTGTYLSLHASSPHVLAWQDSPPYGAPDVCGYSLDFNTTQAPWNDPRLRWAVSYAVNRQSLVDVAFQGASKPNPSIWSDYPVPNKAVEGLRGEGATYAKAANEHNPAKAAQMFQEAGYTKGGDGLYQSNGKTLALAITNFDSAPKNATTAALVEQLRQAGIDASQVKKTVPNFITSELSGDFQANLFFGTCGTVVGVLPSLDSLNVKHVVPAGQKVSSYYANPFRWDNANAKAYSSHIDQIAQLAPDDPKIETLINQAMPYFYKDLPSVPLLFNYQINPVSTKYWTGWALANDDYNWGYYLDPSLHLVMHRLKPAR